MARDLSADDWVRQSYFQVLQATFVGRTNRWFLFNQQPAADGPELSRGGFMRITDLIFPGQPRRLRHPTVGDVLWTDVPGQGFELVFARGPEKGQILVADETVLLDDTWSVIAGDEEEDSAGSNRPCQGASKSRPIPTTVTSRKQLAAYMERLRGNRLDNPGLWKQPAAEFLDILETSIVSMDCWPEDQRFGINTESPSWALFAWAIWETMRWTPGAAGGKRTDAETDTASDDGT
jgi:hypothetical protein